MTDTSIRFVETSVLENNESVYGSFLSLSTVGVKHPTFCPPFTL